MQKGCGIGETAGRDRKAPRYDVADHNGLRPILCELIVGKSPRLTFPILLLLKHFLVPLHELLKAYMMTGTCKRGGAPLEYRACGEIVLIHHAENPNNSSGL